MESTKRLELMSAFRDMYTGKHLEYEGLDTESGYLETALSDNDRMPMQFFIEYNNNWWFEIISGVDVPTIAYDPDSDSGLIILDIRYEEHTLRAAQHVHFGEDSINRIRTYAPSTFFQTAHPLVELDSHGNSIWLETGYDLKNSTKAALGFLDTPRGLSFAENEMTAASIGRIRENLARLQEKLDS